MLCSPCETARPATEQPIKDSMERQDHILFTHSNGGNTQLSQHQLGYKAQNLSLNFRLMHLGGLQMTKFVQKPPWSLYK